MRFLPNGLGPKLNLSLLIFVVLLGAATAFLVFAGFRSTQSDATKRSRDGLEIQAKVTLRVLAQTQADFGQVQLEATAGLGQQAARYFVASIGAPTSFDPSRLVKAPSGQSYDPTAGRTTSVMVPASVPLSDAVLRDARDSAALDAVFPAILAGFTGGARSVNFDAISVYFNSPTGFTRYYPAIPVEQFPVDADPRNLVAIAGPGGNPSRMTVWTAPYIDETGRGTVLTVLIPIYSGDEYRGIIGMDVSLDRLAAQIDDLRPTEHGYSFYLDKNGNLLRSHSYDVVKSAIEDPGNAGFASAIAAMKNGRSEVVRTQINGADAFVSFAPVGGVGGSLAIVTPIDDVTAQATLVASDINSQGNRTIAFVLTTMMAFFVVALIAAALINRRFLLQPIDALVRGTRAVASGDYDTSLLVRTGDELGLLAESFNGMTSQLLTSRRAVEARNAELEAQVVERTRAEDELREREEQYRSVFQATTDGLLISTLDGQIIEVNDAAAAMHGYTRDEFLALPRDAHVGPESVAARDRYLKALREEGSYRGRAINVRKDGSTFPVEFHGARFTYQGTPHGLAVIRDISGRVAAEQALAHRAALSALGADVGSALTSDIPLRDTLQRCTEAVVRHLDAVQARIWTIDREMVVFELQASAGLDPGIDDEFRRVPVLPDDVANRALIVNDMLSDPRLNSIDHERARRDGLVAMARYPLVVDGDVVGLMMVFTRARLTDVTVDALPSIAGAIGVAIKRDQAEREVRESRQLLEQRVVERTRELSALLDVSQTVASTLDLTRLLSLILDQLQSVAGYTSCSILTVDDDDLVVTDSRGPFVASDVPAIGIRLPLAAMQPFWERMEAGSVISIGDLSSDTEDSRTYHEIIAGLADAPEFTLARSLMIVPLGWKDRVIGMLTLAHEQPHYYHEQHRRLAGGIAAQAAVAIENARLFAQAEERTHELATLLDLSRKIASTIALEPLLDLILEQIQSVAPYDRAVFMLLDDGELVVRSVSTRPGGEEGLIRQRIGLTFPTADSPMWDRIRSGDPVIAADVRDGSGIAQAYQSTVGEHFDTVFADIHSWMGVPVISKDRVIGMLAISSKQVDLYRPRHGELARAIASQAAVAVENARLFEETQERTRELTTLLDVSHDVASTLDTTHLVGLILDQLKRVIDYTGSSVSLFVAADVIEIVESRPARDNDTRGMRMPSDRAPLIWEQVRRLEAVTIPDIRDPKDPYARDYLASIGAAIDLPAFKNIRSWMGIPLAPKDQAIGLLSMSRTEPNYFTDRHARLARAIADQAAIALDNARLFEETQRRARETEALFRADEELFRSLNIDAVFDALVAVMVDVLEVDKCMVSTIDDEEGRYTIRASRNIAPASLEEMMRIRRLQPRRTLATITGPIINEDAVAGIPEMADVFNAEGIRSTMDIPILSAMGTRAAFSCAYTGPHTYTLDEQRLFQALAERASVALDNAELYQKSQQVASLEERQRLARELHDSVSQALYGIALGARTARTLLDRDPLRAIAPVDYVLQLAEAGLAEMRALIFELRPESLESEGLVAAIGKHVAATQARYGIAVEADMCPEPDAPLGVKEAIYRIAQEALHNVVKHAHAAHIDVRLTAGDGEITIEVRDDGDGFDTGGEFPGHIGLSSMRERAINAGGTLDITSTPGDGTRVFGRIALRPSAAP